VDTVRAPRTFLSDEAELDDVADLEATRIVNRISGNRFVLQFSTGESFTVHGSGLIGRNPQPEPGEFFDHLVRVLDTGKSVSKTHLEFGQESGAFWLKDRFSGNGTIIREPDISARRAEPDRRYRVMRGTRVDIGEQFFVVS
jgi:pSer/pThr/pTyr-binding forkhead associated (FHA) protein